MELPKKQVNIIRSLLTLSDDGTNKAKLKLFEQKAITEDIAYLHQMEKILYMQESHHLNNLKILKDKSSFSNKNILTTKLLKTLPQELILKEKDCKKFWTKHLKKKSNTLWLPQKTDLLDLDMNYLKKYSEDLGFPLLLLNQKNTDRPNKSYQKIFCQLSQSSLQDTMAQENIITRKIRIYPNEKQKTFFNKCFGASRLIYNKVVDYVNKSYKQDIETYKKQSKKGCVKCGEKQENANEFFCVKHKKTKLKYSFNANLPFLIKQVMVPDKELPKKLEWLKEVPYDTRQLIIKDFCEAYKSAISNKNKGNIKFFEFNYKSKKNPTQFFHVDKRAIKSDLTIFKARKLGKLRVRKKMKKWIKNNLNSVEHNCKIICYKPNQYYLLINIKQKQSDTKSKLNTVSLDPGIRTFQTFYSSDGICGKIGDRFTEKTNKIFEKINALNSVKSKKRGKTKYNLANRISLLRTKIKNMVNDLHWKTAHFLTANFNTIIIPKFESKNMSKKTTRNIGKKTTTNLLHLSHYKFLIKLMYKCKMNNKNLVIMNESYTSKTCGQCGKINSELGSNKIFTCSKCKLEIDRDVNGARNIMLKML